MIAVALMLAGCLGVSGCSALQRLIPPTFDTETLNATSCLLYTSRCV